MGNIGCGGLCDRQDFIEKYNVQFTKTYDGKTKKLTTLRMEKYVEGYTKCRRCETVYPPQLKVEPPYVRHTFINTSVMVCPCCHYKTAWTPSSKPRSRKLSRMRKEYIENSIVIKQV